MRLIQIQPAKQVIALEPHYRKTRPIGRDTSSRFWRMSRVIFIVALISIATTSFNINLGGVSLGLERALGLVLVPAMIVALVVDHNPYPQRRLVFLFLIWVLIELIALLLTSNRAAHLPGLVIAAIPTAYFWFIARGDLPHDFVNRCVRTLLWVFVVSGTGALVLRAVGLEIPLLFDSLGRLKGLTLEPNIFGSTVGFLVFVTLPRARLNWVAFLLYGLAAVVLVASLSKAPLAAFVIAAVIYGICRAIAARVGLNMSLLIPVWLALIGIVAALAFSQQVETFYRESLLREDALRVRSYMNNLALQRWEEKPVFGNGPGDFSLLNVNILRQFGGENDKNNLWIGQMMVNILHDSGVVGLFSYIFMLLASVWFGIRALLQGSKDHAGYLAGFAMVLLCSQATSVHLNAIFGVALGLVVISPALPKRLRRTSRYNGNENIQPAGERSPATSDIQA